MKHEKHEQLVEIRHALLFYMWISKIDEKNWGAQKADVSLGACISIQLERFRATPWTVTLSPKSTGLGYYEIQITSYYQPARKFILLPGTSGKDNDIDFKTMLAKLKSWIISYWKAAYTRYKQ